MTIRAYDTPNGDRYVYEYTGKVQPDIDTVMNVYNGKSKDIRVKGIKLKKGAEDIGTGEGLVKNFFRGLSFSASRKAENNSRALDQWE